VLVQLMLAEQVPVRHAEGRIHGFLVLRDLDDHILASGEVTQLANGNRVSIELRFHFKDGSIHEETAVFSQRRTFQLLPYHLVQKGRAFQHPIDMSLNAPTGQVIIHYADDEGTEKTITDRLKLPADLANGIGTTLLSDIDPKAPKTTLSMLVATPKPRLVKLEISPTGEDSFSIGGVAAKALVYTVKVDIGGISGVIAPIFGKQPPDTHIWMVGGRAPGFLKIGRAPIPGRPCLAHRNGKSCMAEGRLRAKAVTRPGFPAASAPVFGYRHNFAGLSRTVRGAAALRHDQGGSGSSKNGHRRDSLPIFQNANQRPNAALSGDAAAPEKVDQQRNHGYYQQNVDQPAGSMECKKSQQPQDK